MVGWEQDGVYDHVIKEVGHRSYLPGIMRFFKRVAFVSNSMILNDDIWCELQSLINWIDESIPYPIQPSTSYVELEVSTIGLHTLSWQLWHFSIQLWSKITMWHVIIDWSWCGAKGDYKSTCEAWTYHGYVIWTCGLHWTWYARWPTQKYGPHYTYLFPFIQHNTRWRWWWWWSLLCRFPPS